MGEENIKKLVLKGLNIVVAEDVEANYFFMESILIDDGANVLWAKNGEEAIKLVKENQIDAVLMDLKMPVLDGFDATRAIKSMKPNLPVIVQTAYAFSHDEKKAYEYGCDEYLAKPIDPDQLIAIIQKSIAKNK